MSIFDDIIQDIWVWGASQTGRWR